MRRYGTSEGKKSDVLIIEVHVTDHYPEESLRSYLMMEIKISILSLNVCRGILKILMFFFFFLIGRVKGS